MRKLGLFAIGLTLCAATTALAQQTDFSEQRLYDRLDRVERELINVQREVFQKQAAPAAAGAPAPAGAALPLRKKKSNGEAGEVDIDALAAHVEAQQQMIADIQARLGQIEEGVRTLTGAVEQVQFDNTKIRDEFKQYSQDVDFRLKGGVAATPKAAADAKKQDGFDDGTQVLGTIVVDEKAGGKTEEITKDSPKTDDEAQKLYDLSFAQLKDGKYGDAQKGFEKFVVEYPKHNLLSNAFYWLGESHFARKEYEAAAVEFLKGYKAQPQGSKAPDSMLKLAVSLSAVQKEQEACTVYAKLDKEYPNANVSIKRRAEIEKTKLKCSTR